MLYRVDLRTIEEDLRRGSYPDLADTPTFTGMLAAGACGRASDTRGRERETALADADHALRGLELLHDVTGVPGLLARGVWCAPEPPPTPARRGWLAGSGALAAYRWRGDVSMDQYANGLLPALAECASHFPERVRRLAVSTAEHLLAHDMRLVDPDGRQTRYGDLSPGSGFGFNSIARLTGYAVFALAASLDLDPRFAERRDLLRDEHRVPATSKRTNLRVLGITNHSNDLMAWNLYRALVPLARRTADPALGDLLEGMRRVRERVRPDENAYFTLLACRLEPEACDAEAVARARALLAELPSDRRKLAPPAELAQVGRRLLPGRDFHRLARHPVPMRLRPASSFEWKSSPYRLDFRVSPEIEYTGLDFLVAYWLLPESPAGTALH